MSTNFHKTIDNILIFVYNTYSEESLPNLIESSFKGCDGESKTSEVVSASVGAVRACALSRLSENHSRAVYQKSQILRD